MPLSVCEKRCSTINMTLMTMATLETSMDQSQVIIFYVILELKQISNFVFLDCFNFAYSRSHFFYVCRL